MATASAPPPTDAPPATPTTPRTIVHPWLRWPFRVYNVVLGFLVLALLGNIAVAPLARGTKN